MNEDYDDIKLVNKDEIIIRLRFKFVLAGFGEIVSQRQDSLYLPQWTTSDSYHTLPGHSNPGETKCTEATNPELGSVVL